MHHVTALVGHLQLATRYTAHRHTELAGCLELDAQSCNCAASGETSDELEHCCSKVVLCQLTEQHISKDALTVCNQTKFALSMFCTACPRLKFPSY